MGRARRVASRRRDRSIDRSIEGRDATASDASDRARVGANDDGDGDDERERCRAVVARGRSGTNADERGMDGGWEARVRERWGREDERRCVRRLGSEHGGGEDARVGRAGARGESDGDAGGVSETRADGISGRFRRGIRGESERGGGKCG